MVLIEELNNDRTGPTRCVPAYSGDATNSYVSTVLGRELMFESFPKIPRLKREVTVTEKIDGTNAQIQWLNPGEEDWDITSESRVLAKIDGLWLLAGSRKRYITSNDDNFGFAAWVQANAEELFGLGPGRHYGEWWGSGIQRGYGLDNGQKRFSLFNTERWETGAPACCDVVPVLGTLPEFDSASLDLIIGNLQRGGSYAAPGYRKPEGIVLWHKAAQQAFKYTFGGDGHKPVAKRTQLFGWVR